MPQRFCKTYDKKDYDIIHNQFQKLCKATDDKLDLDPSKYFDNDKNFRAEPYWIDVYTNNKNNDITYLWYHIRIAM